MSKTPIRDKVIFYISVASSTFLLLMYLNYSVFKSDFVLIGVVREMFTFPSMMAQPVLIIIGGIGFDLNQRQLKSYAFYTVLISLTTFLLLIYSFS